MAACEHGLPLTLQPMLVVMLQDDFGKPVRTVGPVPLHRAREYVRDHPDARIAFGTRVKSVEEAQRYGACVVKDDAGNVYAYYETPTPHAIICSRCSKPLAVYVDSGGLPPIVK